MSQSEYLNCIENIQRVLNLMWGGGSSGFVTSPIFVELIFLHDSGITPVSNTVVKGVYCCFHYHSHYLLLFSL